MDKSYHDDSLVFKGHLDKNVYQEVPQESDKNVFKKFKSLLEKYITNLTKRKVDYLTNFKWQSSNIYCTQKLHKYKTIQEAIALATGGFFNQKMSGQEWEIYMLNLPFYYHLCVASF